MASSQVAVHESLKAFLIKKNFLAGKFAAQEGWPPEAELAYKSFAEHKCGIGKPQNVPINLLQIHPVILDDADWEYFEHLEEKDPEIEPQVDNDELEVDGEDDDIMIDEDENEDEKEDTSAVVEGSQSKALEGVMRAEDNANQAQGPTESQGDPVVSEQDPGAVSGEQNEPTSEGSTEEGNDEEPDTDESDDVEKA